MSTEGRTSDLATLAFVDEHSVIIAAEPERVWLELTAIAPRAFGGPISSQIARALGATHSSASGPVTTEGSTIPGFRVARAVAPAVLALEGEHRFSRYALIFRVDDLIGDRTRLRAETLADFPGFKGKAYRALVIGSRSHVLVVRRILRVVKRRAERVR